MSLAAITPIIGGVQSAVSSAATINNILAGLVPSLSGLDAISILAKDIGGFEFDYIGEERVEAGAEITKHFTESNQFMQDHVAVQPTVIIMRGFAAEQTFNKSSIIPALTALATALTPVTPYLNKYSPGASKTMSKAVTQTLSILQAISQIQNLYGSIVKLSGALGGPLGTRTSRVQQAYNSLDALRTCGFPFAVVTPWATFGDTSNVNIPSAGFFSRSTLGLPGKNTIKVPHGPMMIENMVLVSPEETRGWADIIVRLIEIRVAPSLLVNTMGNARTGDGGVSSISGTVAHP